MATRMAAAKRSADDVILEALSTGKVVLQSRGLTECPHTLFQAHVSPELQERTGTKWWAVEPLKLLDLSFNTITRLPPEIEMFKESLTQLRMSGNALTTVPRELCSCSSLKALDLSKNRLDTLPMEINSLYALVELDVSFNALTSLPPLTGLRMLELLRMKGNALHEIADTMDAMPRLLEMDAAQNKLRRIPSSIGSCGRLKMLLLAQNELSELPRSLSACTGLQQLDVRQNHLSSMVSLPENEILTEVMLGWNALVELRPADIVRASVTTLDVSNNRLTALPDELRRMRALHTLDVSNNDIQSLPAWLGFMPALTRLQVEGNPLRTMRRAVVTGGTPSLKAYLKTRATDEEAIVWERELGGSGATPPRDRSGAAAPSFRAEAPAAAPPQHSATYAAAPYGPGRDAPAEGTGWLRRTAVMDATPLGNESSGSTAAGPRHADTRPDAAAVVKAVHEERMDSGWTHVLRDSAATGRVTVPPTAFPAKLTHVRLDTLSGGKLDLLPRIKSLVLDGHTIDPESGIPEGLQLVLPQLQELSLSHNGLRHVPVGVLRPSAASLDALRSPVVGLRSLNLSRNALNDEALQVHLPETLEDLDLRSNALQRPPGCLDGLSRLRTLILGDNRITLRDLPAGTLRNSDDDVFWLPSLERLDLSSNKLTRLPAAVLALPKCHTLNVADNELQIIPPHAGSMPALQSLNVEGNPQRGIRFALAQKGGAAVLAYLRSRIPPGTEDQYVHLYAHSSRADTLAASSEPVDPRGRARAVPPLPQPAMHVEPVEIAPQTPSAARAPSGRPPLPSTRGAANEFEEHLVAPASSRTSYMPGAYGPAGYPQDGRSTPSGAVPSLHSSRGSTPYQQDDMYGQPPYPHAPYMPPHGMAYAMPYAVPMPMPVPVPMHMMEGMMAGGWPMYPPPPDSTSIDGVQSVRRVPSGRMSMMPAYDRRPPPDEVEPSARTDVGAPDRHAPASMSSAEPYAAPPTTVPAPAPSASARVPASSWDDAPLPTSKRAAPAPALAAAASSAQPSSKSSSTSAPSAAPPSSSDASPAARLADVRAQMAEITAAMERADKDAASAMRRQLNLLRAQEVRWKREAGVA